MDEAEKEFRREVYAQCFQEKRHYDLMSWTIGGAITLVSTLLIGQMFRLPESVPSPDLVRFGLAAVVTALSLLWWSIYERNRFWGEVCNETAREIERALGIDGLGQAYMRAAIRHEIVLSNVGLDGAPVAGPKGPAAPRTERDASRRSIHVPIRALIFAPALLALAIAVLLAS